MYRVRKKWTDASSQKGAFEVLENAKRCADDTGCSVYDEKGARVYPHVVAISGSKITLDGKAVTVWKQSALGGALASQLKSTAAAAAARRWRPPSRARPPLRRR